jgi:hypothetical protein
VAARLQYALGLFEVAGIRRGHVHCAHPVVAEQLVEIAVDPRNRQCIGYRLRSGRRRAQEPDYVDPDPPQSFDVNWTDKAPADHGGPRSISDYRW